MREYELRGNRVEPMAAGHIQSVALALAKEFKFSQRRKKKCEQGFERLSELGVTLSVIDNDDWLGVTKGHFDHTSMTISIPENIYEDACMGDKDALFVMLHELGHLFLMHRPLLHSSSIPAEKFEDAEWQADTFADAILKHMGYRSEQLTFDFYIL